MSWSGREAPRKRFAAHARQNSSQSRIRRIDRKARDKIEGHRCRVFPDATRKDTHRSTQGYLPLGKAVRQGRECRRAPSGSRNGVKRKSLLWDVSSARGDHDLPTRRILPQGCWNAICMAAWHLSAIRILIYATAKVARTRIVTIPLCLPTWFHWS
jgi:hypothetical protein